MRFRIFPVTGIVLEEEPVSFYMAVVDGVSSLDEMVGNHSVPLVFYVIKVFFEAWSAMCSVALWLIAYGKEATVTVGEPSCHTSKDHERNVSDTA